MINGDKIASLKNYYRFFIGTVLFLFVFCFIATSHIHAQDEFNGFARIDTTWEFQVKSTSEVPELRKVYVIHADESENSIKYIEYKIDKRSENWKSLRSEKSYYFGDTLSEKMLSRMGKEYSKVIFRYDEKGRLISEQAFPNSKNKYKFMEKIIDYNGRDFSISRTNNSEHNVDVLQRSSHVIDSHGRKISRILQRSEKVDTFLYQYEGTSVIPKWVQKYNTRYRFSQEASKVVSIEKDIWNEETKEYITENKRLFFYDSSRLSKDIKENGDEVKKSIFSYDKSGNLIELIRITEYAGEPMHYLKTTYEDYIHLPKFKNAKWNLGSHLGSILLKPTVDELVEIYESSDDLIADRYYDISLPKIVTRYRSNDGENWVKDKITKYSFSK